MAKRPKNFYGMHLYEDWMDYRGAPNSQRSNSIVSRGELAKSQARSRFQLHSAYAESFISEDVQEKILVDQKEQVRETRRISSIKPTVPTLRSNSVSSTSSSMSSKEKKALIKSIVDDFGPFYDWITNGRKDDMDEETIKKFLFKK